MTASRPKLGLVVGGGGLPPSLIARCQASGRPFFVIRLKGFADDQTLSAPHVTVGIAEIGKIIACLRAEACQALCFAGLVQRPDFASLKPDLKGLSLLPGVIAAAAQGDDGLMRHMLNIFEREGFQIEGADQIGDDLTLPAGPLGLHAPQPTHQSDISQALRVARAMGELDIGQGCVVVAGLVLAVEAQEGTEAMLRRCIGLADAIKGNPDHRKGVLAKCPKPIQDLRIDMPTIGLSTVERAAEAGLSGIVGEAGRLLVLDRQAVIAAADAAGLFIFGAAAP